MNSRPMFVERYVSYSMASFRGHASWVKMTSPGGKLTALACNTTKSVNKAEELTYLSTNIALGKSQDKGH